MYKKLVMNYKFFILSIIIIGLLLNSFNYIVRSENDFLNKPSILSYNCYDNKPYIKDINGFIFFLDLEVDKKIVINNNSLGYYLLNNSKNIDIVSTDFKIIEENKNSYIIRYIFRTDFFNGSGFDFVPKIDVYDYKELAWFNSLWMYKKKITIESDYVDEDRINFVFPVNITDEDLKDYAQNDGDDIMFINGSENLQFKHEIEYYSNTYGNLIAWVNVTYISHTVDTELYMYFGNPTCGSQESITDTWNSDYLIVHHLHETPSDGNDFHDSTINDNDGTWENPSGQGSTGVTNVFDNGVMFSDTNVDNYIDLGSQTGFSSVSLWFNCPSKSGYDFLFGHDNFRMYIHGTDNHMYFSDSSGHTIYTWDWSITSHLGEWIHFVCITNGTNSKLYIDNVEYTAVLQDFESVSSQATNLGRWTGDNHYCDDYMDEVEVYASCLNANYVDTLFNSQQYAYDGGFFSIGELEERPYNEMIYSNPTPSNNSEVNCLNLTSWCITVTSSLNQTSGWVNITLQNVTYSNQSFTGNNTYCLNLTNFNLSECLTYTIYVNSSNGTSPINSSFYRFSCICGCECYNEFAIINYKIDYIMDNMIKESDNIYIDFATNLYSIILTLVLFLFFFSIGYKENKRSGGVFMLLSGFIFLSLEFLISNYLNSLYFVPLFTPIAIFIILLGIRKWLFMPEKEKTKSEGQ